MIKTHHITGTEMTDNVRTTEIINEIDDLETCISHLKALQGNPAWTRWGNGSANSAILKIRTVIAELELELHDHWLTVGPDVHDHWLTSDNR